MKTLYVATIRNDTKRMPFRLTVMHQRVLACLATHYFLDVSQLLRLAGYSDHSVTKMRASTKDLHDHGYLWKRAQPRETMRGSLKALFCLTPKGVQAVAAAGLTVATPITPAEFRALKPLHLEHLRQVNDTTIQLHRLCAAYPAAVTIEQFLHERDLKRLSPQLTLPDGATTRYSPDGFVTLRLHRPDGDKRRRLTFEIDRGSMKRTGPFGWQMKLKRLSAWLAGPYREQFSKETATIAIIATEGDQHAARLKRWLELTLRTDLGRADLGPSIFIAGAAPASLSPEALFTAPRWRRCFSDTAEPLVPGVLA